MTLRGLCFCCVLAAAPVSAATLEVGPSKRFARIEDANTQASPGDVILIYPRPGNEPYRQTAVSVRQKQLTFRGVMGSDGQRIRISGQGFLYSGIGRTPRAIFQFNPGADDGTLEGFELSEAHNESHNGAGVRINLADRITIRNCLIHHNDMGLMSNGDGTLNHGREQRIEGCTIANNGDISDPGYNHNLYLGGASVTLSACEIFGSLTGHNVKSRAHYTRVEYCYVHDSANREFDLVDAAETTRPGSHAVLLGNIIVKDSLGKGNRGVIHFGQDGKRPHNGTLYLVSNTIVTPFVAPVIDLSTAGAQARLIGNLITDSGAGQRNQQLATARNGAQLSAVAGSHNWLSGGFEETPGCRLDPQTNSFYRAGAGLFINPAAHDYRLTPAAAARALVPLAEAELHVPSLDDAAAAQSHPLAWQYRHPAGKEQRPLGARFILGAVGQP